LVKVRISYSARLEGEGEATTTVDLYADMPVEDYALHRLLCKYALGLLEQQVKIYKGGGKS
jgi:hypothetical protein